jgi:flagellin-specific chaperone FliS
MYYPHQQKANQQYVQTQVMSADPLQLVILTYDVAIAGCRARDMEKTHRAINELQVSLNHDEGGQIAADLLGLYLYCREITRQGDFDQALKILLDLRQTWVDLRKQMMNQPKPEMAMSLAA